MKEINGKHSYENDKLSSLFKEVQDIRYGRAKPQPQTNFNRFDTSQIQFNRVYVVDKKFNALGVIIGILLLILFATSIQGNYIFATTEKEKVAINTFEENEDKIDVMQVISTNISELTKKEIETKQVEFPYETERIENDKLPKAEEKIIQPGKFGYKNQTAIKTYENNEVTDERIINEEIISNPVNLVIEVGTSEFLYNKKVHIGDKMFTTSDTNIYSTENENEGLIGVIYENLDVTLISEENGWAKVSIDGLEGYVKGEYLTSEGLTPGISEIARKKRIKLSLNMDMPLNVPSGLTRADFTKILSGNSSDVNHIFEDNAGLFYDIEQKYNVNGVFLAAIGIHESGWGTSDISLRKKNLFGYKAYDSSPSESSANFESYQYGIEIVAKMLAKDYLNERGKVIYNNEVATGNYYNGPTVSGVNVKYASDTEWATKIYNTMVSLYDGI